MTQPQRIARLVRRWRRDAKTIRSMAQDVVGVVPYQASIARAVILERAAHELEQAIRRPRGR